MGEASLCVLIIGGVLHLVQALSDQEAAGRGISIGSGVPSDTELDEHRAVLPAAALAQVTAMCLSWAFLNGLTCWLTHCGPCTTVLPAMVQLLSGC